MGRKRLEKGWNRALSDNPAGADRFARRLHFATVNATPGDGRSAFA